MAEASALGGIFSGANIGFAVVTQGISAITSGILQAKNDYERDMGICRNIDAANKSIEKIKALRAVLAKDKTIQVGTQQEFLDLVPMIQNEKKIILSKKNTFMTRLLITIIANIMIVLFISFQILS